MNSEVVEKTGSIRGIKISWVDVLVAGHTVEQVLSFDVAEAEAVYGRPFDDEMDRHIQMGMFAKDRIAADGTMHRVASAVSYVLDGRCIRTAKIGHCREIEPMSAGWTITKSDGSTMEPAPWSCVRGTPALPHRGLTLEDNITRFLRRVVEKAMDCLEEELRPNKMGWWAGAFGKGHRFYHLWYTRAPWSQWRMSYRIDLCRRLTDAASAAPWHADVAFTYLRADNEDLGRWLRNVNIQDKSDSRADDTELDDGPETDDYGVLKVSLYSDELNEEFAAQLAANMTNLIQKVTPAVDAFELERQDRLDEVTHFLKGVEAIVARNLSDDLKPDGSSGWADRSGDRRFYQLWYSREPWKRKGLSYGLNLFPPDELGAALYDEQTPGNSGDVKAGALWEASVDFAYWGCGNATLKSKLEKLFVMEEQTNDFGVLLVHRQSGALDEQFAKELATTLARFMEKITPVVDKSEVEQLDKSSLG